MINPNISGPKNGYTIPIAFRAEAIVADGVPDHAAVADLNVMNADVMNDDIAHKLNGYASTIGNYYIGSTPINGLVTGHDQLLTQPDLHAMCKYDPEWLFLDHGMS